MAAGRLLRSDGCFVALFHHRFIIPFRMTEQEAEDGAGFLPACGGSRFGLSYDDDDEIVFILKS